MEDNRKKFVLVCVLVLWSTLCCPQLHVKIEPYTSVIKEDDRSFAYKEIISKLNGNRFMVFYNRATNKCCVIVAPTDWDDIFQVFIIRNQKNTHNINSEFLDNIVYNRKIQDDSGLISWALDSMRVKVSDSVKCDIPQLEFDNILRIYDEYHLSEYQYVFTSVPSQVEQHKQVSVDKIKQLEYVFEWFVNCGFEPIPIQLNMTVKD